MFTIFKVLKPNIHNNMNFMLLERKSPNAEKYQVPKSQM